MVASGARLTGQSSAIECGLLGEAARHSKTLFCAEPGVGNDKAVQSGHLALANANREGLKP